MADHVATTTQSRRPWRATARTVFQAVVALAAGLPLILAAAGLGEAVPGVAVTLAVAAALTRVMALPWTEDFLRRFVPWLAADPAPFDKGGVVTANGTWSTGHDQRTYSSGDDQQLPPADPAR